LRSAPATERRRRNDATVSVIGGSPTDRLSTFSLSSAARSAGGPASDRVGRDGAINPAATVPCHPKLHPDVPRGTRTTDGEYQLGARARVALVSLTLSASFGLAGCAAIDDLKASIFKWFDTVKFPGGGEALARNAPEARVVPPAEIPTQASKRPRKKIEADPRKLPRPQTVVLPPKKPPIAEAPKSAMPGETEGHSARSPSMGSRTPYLETPPPFEERFCAECWGLPAKAE
jgi:hypothetical protein